MRKPLYIIVALFIALAAFLYFSSPIQAAITRIANSVRVSSGLVGYWTFDGKDINWATGVVSDVSGQGNNGNQIKMSTSTSPVAGIAGQGLFFPGGASYLKLPHDTAFNASGTPITVTFWIKGDPRTASVSSARVLSLSANGSNTKGWGFAYTAQTLNVVFQNNSGTVVVSRAAGSSAIPYNTWIHVAVTMLVDTETLDNNDIQIYINGVQNQGSLTKTSLPSILTDASSLFLTGRFSDRRAIATVDDLRIYNRALSSGEIQYLYRKNAKEFGNKIGTPITSATGGTITKSGEYTIHTFTTSGTFTPNKSMDVEVLVVAGGGGGSGGGGGAGGLLHNTAFAVTAQAYTVTVGDGGAGGRNGTADGSNGSNSVFSSLTAIGGGGGGKNDNDGLAGGSGGGGGLTGGTLNAGGAGTAGQGFAGGGTGDNTGALPSGGGGGAGEEGSPGAAGSISGDGGDGLEINITGTPTYYAGGGGGAAWISPATPGAGGLGGGGAGIDEAGEGQTSNPGTANTGGGGGGGGAGDTGGAGGSGIVIIRYREKPAITNASQNNKFTNGLVGMWSFNGPDINWATGVVSDVSGSGNNGQLINIATSTSPIAGIAGQALTWDSSTDRVTVADSASLDSIDNDMTVAFWVKPNGNQVANNDFYRKNLSGGTTGFGMEDSGGVAPNLTYFAFFGGGSLTCYSNAFTLTNRVWQHVVIRKDDATRDVFINGVDANATCTTAATTITDNNDVLAIGNAQPATGNRGFNGFIDEFRIYNRALSGGEIQELYRSGAR
ncbi:MAG: LamG domain-containing protein [bacterium]|nr:LamG domain-containing protein [bacterium]